MIFGYQNVVNIYKIKSFCADIIQQSRGITLRKRISYAFTSTEKTSPMKVYKGRVRCIPVLVWIGDIKVIKMFENGSEGLNKGCWGASAPTSFYRNMTI